MDFERHQNDLRVQRKANRTLGAIVALLSLCQLLSLGVIAGMVGSERTIIVPPSIDKTYWLPCLRLALMVPLVLLFRESSLWQQKSN